MEECLLATAELGVQGGDSGRPGCPAVGAARGQRGTGSRDTPWLLHRGPTRRSQDDSQPAAPSRAPGCLPAGGTAPPSPGPRPCPPAGHQTTAAEPASAHSSRRSASCSQRRDPRLQGCLAWPGEETAAPGSREPFRNRVRALHWPPGSLDPSCRLSGASATSHHQAQTTTTAWSRGWPPTFSLELFWTSRQIKGCTGGLGSSPPAWGLCLP